jgi:pimeloyl-ACP methyl ester carboxylesterase/DNA-binding CsgD family transcriptional regulator
MSSASVPPVPSAPRHGQQVRFCTGPDGVRLAYATHGSGPPMVVVSCWLSHLQHDWQSPVWRHFLDDLGAICTLLRYDERGFGMSDWNVTDFSIDARVRDLEAVIDATGLATFTVLGMSGGSSVAMAYAARHPDRVQRLVLYGTNSGNRVELDAGRQAREEAYRQLIRAGWATEDPEFRRVFTRIYIPDATEEQMRWYDDLQRMSTSAENAVASRITRMASDVSDEVERIQAPTLILQALGDRATPFSQATAAASRIPNARLVPLDSRNHILLADEPAWPAFMAEVASFLGVDRGPRSSATADRTPAPLVEALSARELEVLRLAAEGLANDAIADALGLSPRTIERHLSNAYAKLGVTGRAARAGAVAEILRRGLA